MIIIDVRSPAEFAQAHAVGAINFPIDSLSVGRRPDLSTTERLAVYCRSGGRAKLAQIILQNDGYQVDNFGGLADLADKNIELVTE